LDALGAELKRYMADTAHRAMRHALWLVALSLGCDRPEPEPAPRAASAREAGDSVIGCSANSVPGLEVTVLDARTRQPLGGYTIRVTGERARPPGAYAESATVRTAGVWHGAGEAPGRYTVRVTRPGYVPWDSADVRLTADACHVIPVQLRVALTPAAAR